MVIIGVQAAPAMVNKICLVEHLIRFETVVCFQFFFQMSDQSRIICGFLWDEQLHKLQVYDSHQKGIQNQPTSRMEHDFDNEQPTNQPGSRIDNQPTNQ